MPDVAVYFVGGLVAFIGGFILGHSQKKAEVRNLLDYIYYNFASSSKVESASAFLESFIATATILTDEDPYALLNEYYKVFKEFKYNE